MPGRPTISDRDGRYTGLPPDIINGADAAPPDASGTGLKPSARTSRLAHQFPLAAGRLGIPSARTVLPGVRADRLLAAADHKSRPQSFLRAALPVATVYWLSAGNIREISASGPSVAARLESLRIPISYSGLRHSRPVPRGKCAEAGAVLPSVCAPVIVADHPCHAIVLASAELVKDPANTFYATKISLINADAMGYDDPTGHRFFATRLGFGGGFLPEDNRGFTTRADELCIGNSLPFLHLEGEVSVSRCARTLQAARVLPGGLFPGRDAAVPGAAITRDSDVRCLPKLSVATSLHLAGAHIRAHSPKATGNALRAFPTLDYALDIKKAGGDAGVGLHLTEWHKYRDMDPAALGSVARNRKVHVSRNALPTDEGREADWSARHLSRSTS